MDSETLKWILGGIASTVPGLAAWAWRQRATGLARERAKDLEITTLKVNLAIAETKLAAYGKSAPELTDQIDHLTERVARLLYEAETDVNRPDTPPPWPYPRRRPTAPRRPSR